MNGPRASHSPWDRRDFRRWSPATRRLWLHLLTGRNLLGCFVLAPAATARETGADPGEVRDALERFEEDGRLLRDPDTDLLLIRRYLEYRPLDPGDRGRAARLADALPFSEPVLAALRRELTEHGG
ncbi:MAG: hypothetical protein Q8W44_07985, partial [Candidatus Palauibacterales bacterium]|nr:hypothetical protein [Candidatus Palauibacterales bacterium]